MSPFKSFLERFRRKEEPSPCPHLIWGQISLHTYGPKCGGLDVSRPLSKNDVLRYCMSEPHKCPIYPAARIIPWSTHPSYVLQDANALAEVKRWLGS